jgi:hypothetical protein
MKIQLNEIPKGFNLAKDAIRRMAKFHKFEYLQINSYENLIHGNTNKCIEVSIKHNGLVIKNNIINSGKNSESNCYLGIYEKLRSMNLLDPISKTKELECLLIKPEIKIDKSEDTSNIFFNASINFGTKFNSVGNTKKEAKNNVINQLYEYVFVKK